MTPVAPPFTLKELSADWIKNFSNERKEPSWVLNLRLQAFKQFEAEPWPNARNEHWKRTDLNVISWDSRKLSSMETQDLHSDDNPTHKPEDIAQSNGAQPGSIYWDYSRGISIDIPETLKKSGLIWTPLGEAIQNHASLIKDNWKSAVEGAQKNKFKSLNLALASQGLCLFIPKNKKIDVPLHQYFSLHSQDTTHFALNFVILDEGSEIQLWEDYESNDSPQQKSQAVPFLSTTTCIHLQSNAKASFYYLQHMDNNTAHLQFQNITQEQNSRLFKVAVELGGRISHNESTINLKGQGAENKVLGVLFGGEKQNFVNWIHQNHTGKQTMSDIRYRSVLQGKSNSFFSGMVSILKDAQLSDAYQSAKSLLLSKGARAEAIPNLEILADDVKCSHGAAAGPVDEDQKYYLQTRGVPPQMAEDIIIQGFFAPVIDAIPSGFIQNKIRNFIEEKLSQHE